MSPNMQAFLDTIAFAEGTAAISESDDGYDVLVNGAVPDKDLGRVRLLDGVRHLFIGYEDHPNILVTVNSHGLQSTAAGRYQQRHVEWPTYKAQLGLDDFGRDAQDAVAIQHIKECGALADVESGDAETAIRKCARIWASFPGNTAGQPQHPIVDLLEKFAAFGGTTV